MSFLTVIRVAAVNSAGGAADCTAHPDVIFDASIPWPAIVRRKAVFLRPERSLESRDDSQSDSGGRNACG